MRYSIGYSTGTFDLTHRGHFAILRYMKSRCDMLVVGLTSDRLAASQKRPTIMDYDHRKAILDNCRHVDHVVAHDGETKTDAHRRLRFDVLFIGDDYADSDEYTQFHDTPVLFVPRTPGVSTSGLWDALVRRVVRDEMVYVACGIDGPVWGAGGCVWKPVHVGAREHQASPLTLAHTADVYRIGVPEPRNWKGGEDDAVKFPMITAVNAYRQLVITSCLRTFPWYPIIDCFCMHEDSLSHETPLTIDGVDALVAERSHPRSTWCLQQRHSGDTLHSLWTKQREICTPQWWAGVMTQLQVIIDDLLVQGVVHGDVHMRNLCMDTNGRLSLIDFGWCMWRGFDMTPAERALLQMRLDDRFDEAHFGRSLRDHGLCLSDGHVVEMVDADQQMVQASTEQSTVGT